MKFAINSTMKEKSHVRVSIGDAFDQLTTTKIIPLQIVVYRAIDQLKSCASSKVTSAMQETKMQLPVSSLSRSLSFILLLSKLNVTWHQVHSFPGHDLDSLDIVDKSVYRWECVLLMYATHCK